jgi:hypothetical protein
MPQFLGRYTPLNPVLSGDLVCDECNNGFGSLERNFHEDSEEGITGQMLNIDDRHSIRLRGRNVQMTRNSGFGVEFLDNIFPFLKHDGDRLIVDLQPQVQLKNYDGVYQVFLPEALKRIKKDGSEFRKVKDRILKLDKKDIRVIAFAMHEKDDEGHASIVQLLADFGIPYEAKETVFAPIETEGKMFEVSMQCTVNHDLGRVLAKVAMNYLAFCAASDGQREALFGENFDKIRRCIAGDEAVPLKEIIVSLDKDVILGEEAQRNKRLLAHVVVFEEVNGQIVARLSFWGKRIYEVVLGSMPEALRGNNFGCGHVFNPFEQQIYNISNEPKYDATEEDMKASFGLYKKVR